MTSARTTGIALVLAGAIAFAPRTARAEEGYFALFGAGVLVPGEVGLARPFDLRMPARATVSWIYQLPLGVFRGEDDEAHRLWRHRLLVGARLNVTQGPSDDVAALFLGYRYRFRHRRGVAPYLGIGTDIGSQVSIAPELGLHFGRDKVFRPGLQLGLRSDIYAVGGASSITALAGWTLF
jgi:hypothetical protein